MFIICTHQVLSFNTFKEYFGEVGKEEQDKPLDPSSEKNKKTITEEPNTIKRIKRKASKKTDL